MLKNTIINSWKNLSQTQNPKISIHPISQKNLFSLKQNTCTTTIHGTCRLTSILLGKLLTQALLTYTIVTHKTKANTKNSLNTSPDLHIARKTFNTSSLNLYHHYSRNTKQTVHQCDFWGQSFNPPPIQHLRTNCNPFVNAILQQPHHHHHHHRQCLPCNTLPNI